MEIRAPFDGLITTWDVKRNFLNRPVTEGQELVELADTRGDWVLEVEVPDHDMGPILEARSRLNSMMAPVEAARETLNQQLEAGLTAANAETLLETCKTMDAGIEKAVNLDVEDLVDIEPLQEALGRFEEALRQLKAGDADAPELAQKTQEALSGALDRATTLSAYFVSATDPEHRYPGYVSRIATRAHLVEQNHVDKVTVGFTDEVRRDYLNRVGPLRPGAEVRARVNCGDARLAYVLLRDVVQFWHESVMFRWPFLH
ncbi:MAG TPA: HlyD family secretion protein, partial [Isosphaeraceae bacterium]|nr:HlyD family secretion protein [Isosphaeraceae bacterium]